MKDQVAITNWRNVISNPAATPNDSSQIFTITRLIAVVICLIGTSVFQTDALRREMNAKFETVNQRFDQNKERVDSLEKRLERIENSLDEIKDELRSQRRSTKR